MNIEERMAKLELQLGRARRHNRWLFVTILLVAGGIFIPALLDTTASRAGAQATGTAKEIRAARFVLEDKSGKARAWLDSSDAGVTLALLDETGKSGVSLGVDIAGPHLLLNGEAGTANLDVLEDGPTLRLVDKFNAAAAYLAVNDNYTVLDLSNEKGVPVTRLWATSEGSRLEMTDDTKQYTSSISLSSSGANLSLGHKKSGKEFTATVDADSSQLGLYEGGWPPRAWLTLSKDGPSLQLFDTKGTVRFAAGRTATETADGKTTSYPESSLILFGPDSKVIWSAIK